MTQTKHRKLRVAVVGAGKMGRHHAKAAGTLDEMAQVTAIADPSAEARAAAEAEFGVRTFADAEELFRADVADVAHICTAPHTHVPLARAALEAGLHVYVEKPIAPTVGEMRELVALAESKGLSICAGHQLLAEPPMRALRELLPALGPIVHVESYFSFRTVRRTPGGRAPLRADLQLLDVLPHPTYLLLDVLHQVAPGVPTRLCSLDAGPPGTVHFTAARGDVHGSLVITLRGRPVESYLKVVGENGTLQADFVRGTLLRLIGPGTSGIDKALNPYRVSWQTGMRTTSALTRRVLGRKLSYPGLAEMFEAFYESVRTGGPSPTPVDTLVEGVDIWQQVEAAFESYRERTEAELGPPQEGRRVVVTGGTGFLGTELVRRLLDRGFAVRVLARREPPAWERLAGAEYVVTDIGAPVDPALLEDAEAVVHTAAETAGGWEDHQRNSLDATEHMLRASAAAGVEQFIHVSSMAVLEGGGALSEDSPLVPDSRSRGPYVWGKLESEKLAAELAKELGIGLRIVRPGSIIDEKAFEPPGRLGKRVGPVFVAVGSGRGRFGTVDVGFAADALAWMVEHFEDAPPLLNLIDPDPPSRGELVKRLRRGNPDLKVAWLPRPVLVPLSGMAVVLQKVLRPKKKAMRVAKVFADQKLDLAKVRSVRDAMAKAGTDAREESVVAARP